MLALTLTLELEAHGSSRLRLAPGKESDYEREQSHAAFLARDAKRRAKEAATGTPTVATVVQQLDELSTADEPVEEQEAADTAAAAEDELDDGEWITPDNVDLHKSRDLGFFPALDPTATPEPDPTDAPADETLVGCMTGDFAMQNVLLQMGMEVVGVGGKRVSQVRTWVLRCHACFKCVRRVTVALIVQALQGPDAQILPLVRQSDAAPDLGHLRPSFAGAPAGLHPPPQSQLPLQQPRHRLFDPGAAAQVVARPA